MKFFLRLRAFLGSTLGAAALILSGCSGASTSTGPVPQTIKQNTAPNLSVTSNLSTPRAMVTIAAPGLIIVAAESRILSQGNGSVLLQQSKGGPRLVTGVTSIRYYVVQPVNSVNPMCPNCEENDNGGGGGGSWCMNGAANASHSGIVTSFGPDPNNPGSYIVTVTIAANSGNVGIGITFGSGFIPDPITLTPGQTRAVWNVESPNNEGTNPTVSAQSSDGGTGLGGFSFC